MRKLFLLFSLGIVFTVGSALYTTVFVEAGWCGSGFTGAGFPLPWYLTIIRYTGPPAPCPIIVDRGPDFGIFPFFAFLFDTIFYAAFALAGNEFYRWGKVKRRSS
jgi:hypothetical protein